MWNTVPRCVCVRGGGFQYYWVHVLIIILFLCQTGLTPLMEAASGGYHEVGMVLINKVLTDQIAHVYVSPNSTHTSILPYESL